MGRGHPLLPSLSKTLNISDEVEVSFGNKSAFTLLFATIFTMALLFFADVSIYSQIFEIFAGKVLLHPKRYEQAGETNVNKMKGILYIYKYKNSICF